ncbi:MAG: hypothetical protein M3498_01620 [Deinococcota bacterium]|nr:hypothetical protein [Deinococcota bacterium]
MFGVFWVLALLLAACGASEEPGRGAAGEDQDDGGHYTVSAEGHFEVVWGKEQIEFQAIEPSDLEAANLRNPLLTIQIRNYNPVGAGPRSRAVPQIRWYSDTTPITGTMNSWIEPADGWQTVATNGQKQVSFTALPGRSSRTLSWPSPYVYQPDARMCAWISAQLEARAPNGDQVWGVLETRICEAAAQRTPQDTILATRKVTDSKGTTRTVQLRHMPGRGHRALVRVEAINPLELSERACLHGQGFSSCARSAVMKESFSNWGVAEFVTGYHDALTGDLCASVGNAGACASGERELLKQHTFTDGINTNVVLVENDKGVFARYRFSLPKDTSIERGSLTFRDVGRNQVLTANPPTGQGEAVLTREQGPLPLGADGYCYLLDVEVIAVKGLDRIEMGGCTDGSNPR